MPLDGPRVSIVTPSYNQGHYLEETIRSVLLQGYPNLEYFIIDGGSTDNSVEIICNYAPWLTYWVSEPDRGQAHAINKGFAQCKGDLLGWINSDDLLLPSAIHHLAATFQQFPTAVLLGDVLNVDEMKGHKWLIRQRDVTFDKMARPWQYGVTWHQPGTYFPRALYQQVGPFDEALRYRFDWDWICCALQVAQVHYLRQPVAQFRYHQDSKTVGEASNWFVEKRQVAQRYWPDTIASDPKLAAAALEILAAESDLTPHNRNSNKARHHLTQAFCSDYRVLKWRRYWLFWLKALMPLSFLHLSRVILRGF